MKLFRFSKNLVWYFYGNKRIYELESIKDINWKTEKNVSNFNKYLFYWVNIYLLHINIYLILLKKYVLRFIIFYRYNKIDITKKSYLIK